MNAAIVDGWFLPQDIYSIYSQGKQNDIPLLTGATNDEGGTVVAVGAPGPANGAEAPDTLAKYTAWANSTFGSKSGTLLKLYPATDDVSAAKAYHDVNRDINFAGHRAWAKLQATTGKSPVYVYIFSHIPPHSTDSNGNQPVRAPGAVHFTDMIYVFNNLRVRDSRWTETDRKVANTMTAYWSNFAKNLNPDGEGLVRWPKYDPQDEKWMNLGDADRVEPFNSAGVDFIASVQEELRRAN